MRRIGDGMWVKGLWGIVAASFGAPLSCAPVMAADESAKPSARTSGIAGSDGVTTAPSLRPAELPPADFTAAQYIGSAGCVL